MRVVRLTTEAHFSEVFDELLRAFSDAWWVLDDVTWDGNRLSEADLEELFAYQDDELSDTRVDAWRAGLFPRYAPYVMVDDFTRVVALRGPREAVVAAFADLHRARRFAATCESYPLALLHVAGGQWYAHAADPGRLEALRARWGGAWVDPREAPA